MPKINQLALALATALAVITPASAIIWCDVVEQSPYITASTLHVTCAKVDVRQLNKTATSRLSPPTLESLVYN